MKTDTFLVKETTNSLVLTIHRSEHQNSINIQFLADIHHILDMAESNSACRFVILQGENDFFCTGMDLQELAKSDPTITTNISFANDYMTLLKRFSTTSKIIISILDGQVLAGGVGIVAASDLVLSTSRTQFGLSEALWGLLPLVLCPF